MGTLEHVLDDLILRSIPSGSCPTVMDRSVEVVIRTPIAGRMDTSSTLRIVRREQDGKRARRTLVSWAGRGLQ